MEGIKTLKVTFDNPTAYGRSSKGYSFKTLLDVKVDEKVLVECSTGIQVCTVVDVKQGASPNATAWAFQKVDQGALSFIKGRELAERESLRRIKELRGRLESKLAAQDSMARFHELARCDPEAAQMLNELLNLERVGAH